MKIVLPHWKIYKSINMIDLQISPLMYDILPKSHMLVVYQTLEDKIKACPYRYVGHSSQSDPRIKMGSSILSWSWINFKMNKNQFPCFSTFDTIIISSKGHFTHEPRAVSMKLWRPKRKRPKAVPRHLQNHVVWSRTLECSVKSYVTWTSTKCYFNECLFMQTLTHDKME